MKRIVGFLLSLCTMLSINTVTFAQSIDVQDAEKESIASIAQNWIDTQLQGNADVSRIVTLKNTSESCIGHLVSFAKNSLPAGYIILSHEETVNPII